MKKYLVSRPMGGLNDILCQIEMCWRYAEQHDRHLIIDTEASGFLDVFSNYFELRDNTSGMIHLSCEPFVGELVNKPHFPPFASVDATRYKAVWNADARNYIGEHSADKITFDFEKTYTEDVLIHHQCGGGHISLDLLRKLRLSEQVSARVKSALALLPQDYVSIHVRNTDLKTDYKEFFGSLSNNVKGKNILICSDDRACIDYGKEFFTDSQIFSVSDIPDTGGKPLHMNANLDRFQANLDMLTDIVCLANGNALHLTRVEKGYLSGFSRLAQNLHKNRDVLEGLTA